MTQTHDDHGDGHDHGSAPELTRRVGHLVAALEAHGIVAEGAVDAVVERTMASAGVARAAKVVARAWVDDDFRARLLADPWPAIGDLVGVGPALSQVKLQVVPNEPGVHNVVVCTLCSCYPIALLGPSPSWYKKEAYRSRVVHDPRGVLAEFGLELPAGTTIRVWDSSAELRYMVLPQRPDGTEALTEEELAGLVTRDSIIGTGVPRR